MTEPDFRDHVELLDGDEVLGWVLVELGLRSGDQMGESSWGGRVSGSDYLVWGANHRRVSLRFNDMTTADAVIRPGGALRGLGDPPPVLQGPALD